MSSCVFFFIRLKFSYRDGIRDQIQAFHQHFSLYSGRRKLFSPFTTFTLSDQNSLNALIQIHILDTGFYLKIGFFNAKKRNDLLNINIAYETASFYSRGRIDFYEILPLQTQQRFREATEAHSWQMGIKKIGNSFSPANVFL